MFKISFNQRSRYLSIVGCLSFASGLCFILSSATLIVFLNDQKLTLAQTGLFLIAHLPHVFKWAAVPLMEKITHPDYRRILLQIGLALKSLILFGFAVSPKLPWVWFCLLLALHLVSSAYECILFVSQVVGLNRSNWGFGEAAGVSGYRCGILAGGAGALSLSVIFSWQVVYMIYAAIMLLPLIPLYFTKITFSPKERPPVVGYAHYLKQAWLNLKDAHPIWWLCAIMFFFRAQDALQGQYTTVYFLKLGYDRGLISFAYKIFGMAMAVLGGFLAAWMIRRKGLYLPLWIGLISHGISTVFLIALGAFPPSTLGLYATAVFYEFTKGLSITPFLSLQIFSCTQAYTMVQLAALSSVTILAIIGFGALGAQLIEPLGWTSFWMLTILANIPAVVLLLKAPTQ
jgi:hypothetical protein